MNRADLAGIISDDASTPTKTFVIEAHPARDCVQLLEQLAGPGHLERTDDAFLFRLWVPEQDDYFWVDQLNKRFWSFHTNMPVAPASRYLKQHIGSRHDLDWVWLPSEHLRTVWPDAHTKGLRSRFEGQSLRGPGKLDDVRLKLSGGSVDFVLDYLSQNLEIRSAVPFDGVEVALNDPDLGSVTEAVDRMGRFAVSGNSLDFHIQFVETVIDRYRKLVELCEQKALGWTELDRSHSESGGRMSGAPIVIEFSRPIEDIENFVDSMFSSREPFRLWGVPHIEDGVAELEAVDLHVGELLRVDIGTNWLRVFLPKGGCGNSIVRLVSNLQHRFDAILSFADSELQAALRGTSRAPSSDNGG
jgi:hypothetical protein